MAAGDFVVRRNASDTTILADTDGGTTDVNWDTAVDNEGTGITYSAGTFTLGETGRFLVMASDQVGTTDTTANERTTTDLQIRLAGTTLREGAGSGYVRRSGGSQEHIAQCMAYVNVASTTGTGDELQIRHTRRDNSTAGDFARIADRSGVSILKLDDTWNFAHYRSSAAFTPSATDHTRNQSNIGTTVEQDGTVFSRTGNQVTVDTANPVLVILTHQVDYGDVLSGRTEMQQSIDFDGAEVGGRGFMQTYGPRGTDNANAASMTSATLIYPNDTGQILEANLISREDPDEDWFCELQLIELPSAAETATVARTTQAGDGNAAGANFAWQTSVNVDTAAFTHTAGNANIDVDNADDYLAIANLGAIDDGGWAGGSQRDVPAISFRVNTTDQSHVGCSSYNRQNGTADHAHMFIGTILPGLAANDSVYVRANRIGTTTGTRASGGGFSLIRRSTLFAVAGDPTISDVGGDEDYRDGETGVVVTGTNFEAVQGTGKVEITQGATYTGAVAQTVTSWGATSITITGVLSTLNPGTCYLWVTNDTGDRNATGFQVTVRRKVEIQLFDSTNVTNGAATTQKLAAPTGSPTFSSGYQMDTAAETTAKDHAADVVTENVVWMEFSTDAPDDQQYEFLIYWDGVEHVVKTVAPKITKGTGATYVETLTSTGTGSTSITDVATYVEDVQSVGTGSTAITDVATYVETLTSTGVGSTAIDDAQTYVETVISTGTGSTAITDVATYVETVTSTGVGSTSVVDSIALVENVQSVGTGSTSITDVATYVETLTSTGTGSTAIDDVQNYVEDVQSVGTGSTTIDDDATRVENLLSVGTGSTTITDILAGALEETVTSTGTGSTSIDDSQTYVETLTSIGTGSTSIDDSQDYLEDVTSTGVGSTTITDVATGGEDVQSVGVGSTSIDDSQTYVETLTSTGTGSTSITDTVASGEDVQSVGVGSTSIDDSQTYVETVTSTGSGSTSIDDSQDYVEVVTSTGVGSTALTDLGSFVENLLSVGTGSTSIVDIITTDIPYTGEFTSTPVSTPVTSVPVLVGVSSTPVGAGRTSTPQPRGT